jgi:predicted membrane-bound mannosyltransferase
MTQEETVEASSHPVERAAEPFPLWGRTTWIVLGIVAIAALLRFWDLGTRAIHHDESLHATYSWYFMRLAPIYVHDPLMHGPFQFHAMALVFKLFGDNEYTARIPAALAGTAIVATPLLLRQWLRPVGTVAASAFLALSPAVLYYSRFAREDIYIALWTVLLFIAVWRFRQDGADRWLNVVAAALALSFATKESAYLTAAVLLVYLDVTLTQAFLDQRGTRGAARWREGVLLAPVAWAIAALWYAVTPLRERLRLTSIPREGDALIVLGILTLPQLAAAVQLPLSIAGIELDGTAERRVAVTTISALLGVAMMVGMFWDTRRWAIVSLIFYGITIPLFTTEFTNLRGGITSDFWGSLDYWIAQQGVRRGEQPWFYYSMMVPLYEFLTLLPALIGGWWLLERRHGLGVLFVVWGAGTFAALTSAGEKMPWLLVHLAIPLAFLAALTIGEGVEWLRARRGHISARVIAPLGAVVGVMLAVVSVRAALLVSFAHPDTPVEPLIYTQTSPDVPKLSRRIHELAAEHPDERLGVVVDDSDGASWPWAWYLRDLPGTTYTPSNVLATTWHPGAVLLALPDNVTGSLRTRAGTGEPYVHRWWFPEEGYRATTGDSLLSDLATGRMLARWARFQRDRIPVEAIGRMDAVAVFPGSTATGSGGPGGPQPAAPR